MPNALGFDILTDYYGPTTHRCIEKDCGFGGPKWKMTDEVMRDHFMTHYREAQAVIDEEGRVAYEITGDVRTQPCRTCGKEFSQPRRRGRPRLTCEGCS